MTDRFPGESKASSERFEVRELIEHPARFSLLYESKDGKLCLFEDADGHITAVSASKLA